MNQRSVNAGAGRPSRTRAVWACLGLVGLLLTGQSGLAQDIGVDPPPPTPEWAAKYRSTYPAPPPVHLTLRPRAEASGTRTVRRGWYTLDRLDARRPDSLGLDSVSGAPPSIYVPNQCVGTRRCPLFVTVGGIGPEWFVPMADKYGMVLLVGGYIKYNGKDLASVWGRYLDAYLKQALHQLAIDPDKIALQGHCGGGPAAFQFGRSNTDVFSRIIVASPEGYVAVTSPKSGKAEFLLVGSMDDGGSHQGPAMYYDWLKFIRDLRRDGLPVQPVLSLRLHEHRLEEIDVMGRWLQESWAHPGRSKAPELHAADSLPVLTVEKVKRLVTFWNSFTQEPESVWVAGLFHPTVVRDSVAEAAAATSMAEFKRKVLPRMDSLMQQAQKLQVALHHDTAAMRAVNAEIQQIMRAAPHEAQPRITPPKFVPNPAALLKDLPLRVGRELVWVRIADVPALAAKYPLVAAKLRAAGLTAQEAEAYRLALLSARATRYAARVAPELAGTAPPGSVLARNAAFMGAHQDILAGLATSNETAMWSHP